MRPNRMTFMRRLRVHRPSAGMILAVVALVAALGGTAIAGGFLTTKKFKKQAVRGPIVYSVTTTALPNPGPTGNSYVTVAANCPSGTRVIGGGIKVSDPTNLGNAYQDDSYVTPTGWVGHVSNYLVGGGSTTATAIAVCATVKKASGSPPVS